MLRGSSGGRRGLPFQLDEPHTRVHVRTRTLLGVYPEVPLSPRLSELEENLDHHGPEVKWLAGITNWPWPSVLLDPLQRVAVLGWEPVFCPPVQNTSTASPSRSSEPASGPWQMLTCYYVRGLPLTTGKLE